MWQEARRQEKHIRTLMVDYKRRAERRRDYYERIKQDPIKFLRVYGRPSKLHLDSEIVKAAENPNNMMPWVGDPSILIDRFDARANLENWENPSSEELKDAVICRLTPVERIEERLCMYERYRCLIHNDYAGVTEAMALKQIEMDEKYGDLEKKRKEEEEANKKVLEPKAAIGFTYEDSTVPTSTGPPSASVVPVPGESDSDGEADSDMDIDVELDLATLGVEGRRQLAKSASLFGLHSTDFVRLLDADQQLETELRLAKALEEEKLQLAGRKSRRARRILKERRSHEKFPKLFTTKVGLLNGQPISRRTVYLSASSSDSGEYPSEEDEVYVGTRGSSAKAAAAQARRARAKPLLSNAVGPSVMIGGMTSISLCRRRNHTSEPGENVRKSGIRPSSSSQGSSRSRSSSSSTDRNSGRRLRREGGRSHGKRSRVEYITAFGEGTDDNTESSNKRHPSLSSNATSWTKNRSPGCATSSLAASVVSKYLDSSKRSVSPKKFGATVHHSTSPSLHRRHAARNRSPAEKFRGARQKPRRTRSHSNSRSSSSSSRSLSNRENIRGKRNLRGPTRSSSSSSTDNWNHDRSRSTRSRRNSSRPRSLSSRRSGSPSPLDDRSSFNRLGESNLRSTSSASFGAGQSSISPVRKRYYRPELESDEGSQLSDSSSNNSVHENRSSGRFPRWRDSGGSNYMAGKTETYSTSGDRNQRSPPKAPADTCSVGKPSLTPQELLKRRMQAQLTKAFNADKKAELEKQLQLERERQLREEGLRRQALLLRRQEDKRARNERRAVAIASGSIPEDLSDSSSTSSDAQTSGRGTRSLHFPASHPDAASDRAPPKHGALAVRPHSQRTPSPSRRSRLPSPPSSTRLRNPKYMQTTQSGMKFTSQDESLPKGDDSSRSFGGRFMSSDSGRSSPYGRPGAAGGSQSAPYSHSRPFNQRGVQHWPTQETGRLSSHRRGLQSPVHLRSLTPNRVDRHSRYP
ncbi:hypothetical protein T265_08700 [Opisthorchis viverrini]|uniref:Suppressor of white apricot N-terminal domain-containing protein n=1 Tax=Opisthorchis viverrini TaxID=6198 RepID=A0A074ZJ99_OPIVI|nr:hypothetical protein T265_08700 [Opisthorchis viverrini]KER23430.1 hypothetical protein T265_08700 [Opisthorchis viverrini]